MLALSPLAAHARKARAQSMSHEQRTARNMQAYSLRLFRDLAKASSK
ncbi:MAG: hypothetical protein JKX92_06195 [Porticoccaceae bacterium]|nr:hypothetical protein [Porticoccaceae bacterium]